jgi:hypothetical protein
MTTPTRTVFLTDSIIPDGGITCDASVESSFPVTNLHNENTSKIFRTSSDGSEMVCSIDLGAAASVDCFALSGHNFSSSGAFKLKWGSTPACTTGSEELSMTPDHFMWYASLEGKLNYRYFAFTASEDTDEGYYQIAEMWMGEYIELDYNPQTPMPIDKESVEVSNETLGGQLWSYKLYKRKSYSFEFTVDMTPAAFTVLENIYKEFGKHRPFFFHLKPSDCGSSYTYDPGFLGRFEEWSFRIDGKDKRPGNVTIVEEK